MPGVKFSAWLSVSERRRISEVAEEWNTSDNFVVRKAIRDALGMGRMSKEPTTETTETTDNENTVSRNS